jgi:uncharacterized protein YajQ (UPF0234 family)
VGGPGSSIEPGRPRRCCVIAAEYSFDVVSRVEMAEVQNAVHQTQKEVSTRFDFRGSRAGVDLDVRAGTLTLLADNDQQMRGLLELLQQRLAKRSVSLRALDVGTPVPAAGGTLRQVITLRQGIPAEKAKQMQKLLRDSRLKVTVQIQNDQLRVAGAKKDDLQAAIALLKGTDLGLDLQFVNYR